MIATWTEAQREAALAWVDEGNSTSTQDYLMQLAQAFGGGKTEEYRIRYRVAVKETPAESIARRSAQAKMRVATIRAKAKLERTRVGNSDRPPHR